MALRNVIHRRNHKERAQPAHRRKLGLLEKHKDYVERAKDHHSKQDRLRRLQQKAALRNPDEFNFGMIKGASNDPLRRPGRGKAHFERRSNVESTPLNNDLVAILKTQDLGYIRSAIRSEEKKVEVLKERIRPSLGFLPSTWLDAKEGRRETLIQHGMLGKDGLVGSSTIAGGAKKTVWVDSVEEARKFKQGTPSTKTVNIESFLDDDELGAGLSDFDESDNEDDLASPINSRNTRRPEKVVGYLVNELFERQRRLDALHEARQKLEVVRNLMSTRGTSARKVQSKEEKLRDAVAQGARTTANGLALPPQDGEADEDDDDDEKEFVVGGRNASSADKKKKTLWKWGRERKK